MNETFVEMALLMDDAAKINEVGNDIGADCKSCRKREIDWEACRLCLDRPFGSAPCCDGHENLDDDIDCPGCPNAQICAEIAEHEWPLAKVAIDFAKQRGGASR